MFQSGGFGAGNSENLEVFLRPHDILVALVASFGTVPAKVDRIVHMGHEIQAELHLEDGQTMMANLTRERFDELNLVANQQVYIKPKEAKSFPMDYSI
jgi:sulfate/thiosulfate transport system ATP-binding protein